jgi:hypothetical protein
MHEANKNRNLLDAYSEAVILASQKISSSVVKLDVLQKKASKKKSQSHVTPNRAGSGSGFIFTPDGYIITIAMSSTIRAKSL